MGTVTHVLDDLDARGLIAHSTDPDALRADMSIPITFYVGFDPTAPSLHIGNLLQLLTARRLQLAGHKPLILVGGSTGLIGDPKDTGERVMHTKETTADWVERIRSQVSHFVDLDGDASARAQTRMLSSPHSGGGTKRWPGPGNTHWPMAKATM